MSVMRGNWSQGASEGINRGTSTGYTYNTSHDSRGGASSSGGFNSGSSHGMSSGVNHSMGVREERDFALPEETFVNLAVRGGYVQSVLMKAGRQFRSSGGKPYMGVVWPQR
jgi:hypothetical protein